MSKTKKLILISSLFISMVLLYSCSAAVDVNMTAWKDVSYKGPKFHKIMAVAIVKDLAYKKAYESEMVQTLKDEGLNAIPSLKIFSPNKDYSEKEMNDLVNKNSIDAILTLKYTGVTVKNIVYNGRTYHEYYADGVSILKTPSYTEKHRVVNVECTLFSAATGKAVWFAQTKTSNYSSLDELAYSLAEKVTDNLIETKLIH